MTARPITLGVVVLALGCGCGESASSSQAPGLGEACEPHVGCADGLGCIERVCQELTVRGEVWWPQSQPPPDPLRVVASRRGVPVVVDGRIDPEAVLAEQSFPMPVTYPRPFDLGGLRADEYVITGYVAVGNRAGIGQEQLTLTPDGMIVGGEPVDSFRVYMLNEVILSSP